MWIVLFVAVAAGGELDGTWSSTQLELVLEDDGGGGYRGSATLQGTTVPLSAQPGPLGLNGVVHTEGEVIPFVAVPTAEMLVVTSEDGIWQLRLTAGGPTTPGAPREVVAQTAFATLDRRAAVAFHEALLFSMEFAGAAPQDRAAVTLELVISELATGLGELPPEDQVALANARDIWTRTQAAWPSTPPAERRAFASSVLTLAFGEGASLYGGPAGQGATSASGYLDVDSLVGVVPGSDCWASAGCTYDASTGSYEMEVYEPPVEVYTPSYDSYDY